MGNWQPGVYNSNYVLSQKSLTNQIKYENTSSVARIDEISIEKYDNGETCILFTTDVNTLNNKKNDEYARLDYNSFFQDLRAHVVGNCGLTYKVSNEEVHCVRAKRGEERLLLQLMTRLEQYDHSLSEIKNKLRSQLLPNKVSVAEIQEAVDYQQQRLNLLKEVLNEEQVSVAKSMSSTRSRRKTSPRKTKRLVRKSRSKTVMRRRA